MTDANKLVSMIVLVVAGLIIAIWGGLFIWRYRQDRARLDAAVIAGRLSAADVAALTSPTWAYGLAIVQILIGVALIAWGLIQYFTKANEAIVVKTNEGLSALSRKMNMEPVAVVKAGGARPAGSRRNNDVFY